MEKIDRLTPAEQGSLEKFRQDVMEICKDRLRGIRLFGSRARRQGDEESDLDLLVLVEGLDERTKIRIWDAAYQVFASTGILLSPLVLSPDQYEKMKGHERLIAQEIEREGISL